MDKKEVITHINIAMGETFKLYLKTNVDNDYISAIAIMSYLKRDEEVLKYLEEHLT